MSNNNKQKVAIVNRYLQYIINSQGGNVQVYKLLNNSQTLRKKIKKNNISRIPNGEKIAKILPHIRPNFFDPYTLQNLAQKQGSKKTILGHVGGFIGGVGKGALGVGKGAVGFGKGAIGAVGGAVAGAATGAVAGAIGGSGKAKNVAVGLGSRYVESIGYKNNLNALKRGNVAHFTEKGGKYISNAAGYKNNNSPKQLQEILEILFELKDFGEFTSTEKREIGKQLGVLLIPLIVKYSQIPDTIDPATGFKVKGKFSNVKAGIMEGIREYLRQGKFANIKANNNEKTRLKKIANAQKLGKMINNAVTVTSTASGPVIKLISQLPTTYTLYKIGANNKLGVLGNVGGQHVQRLVAGAKFGLAPGLMSGAGLINAVRPGTLKNVAAKGLQIGANRIRAYEKKIANRNLYFSSKPILKNFRHKFNLVAGLKKGIPTNVGNAVRIIRTSNFVTQNNINKLNNNNPVYLNTNRNIVFYLKHPNRNYKFNKQENNIRMLHF